MGSDVLLQENTMRTAASYCNRAFLGTGIEDVVLVLLIALREIISFLVHAFHSEGELLGNIMKV